LITNEKGKYYKYLVVAVDENGKLTAVSRGTCYVYAYAADGTMTRIKVKVK